MLSFIDTMSLTLFDQGQTGQDLCMSTDTVDAFTTIFHLSIT